MLATGTDVLYFHLAMTQLPSASSKVRVHICLVSVSFCFTLFRFLKFFLSHGWVFLYNIDVLPHWHNSCRSSLPSHLVTVREVHVSQHVWEIRHSALTLGSFFSTWRDYSHHLTLQLILVCVALTFNHRDRNS